MNDVLRLLVEAKADLNHNPLPRKQPEKRTKKLSAFHLLAKYFPNSPALFAFFLKHEADPNERDYKGRTVLERMLQEMGKRERKSSKVIQQIERDNLLFSHEMRKLQGMYQLLACDLPQLKKLRKYKPSLSSSSSDDSESERPNSPRAREKADSQSESESDSESGSASDPEEEEVKKYPGPAGSSNSASDEMKTQLMKWLGVFLRAEEKKYNTHQSFAVEPAEMPFASANSSSSSIVGPAHLTEESVSVGTSISDNPTQQFTTHSSE